MLTEHTIKAIIAGALGFATPIVFVIALMAIIEGSKWIGAYGMQPAHYWAGFFMPLAIGAVFVCTMPFWID